MRFSAVVALAFGAVASALPTDTTPNPELVDRQFPPDVPRPTCNQGHFEACVIPAQWAYPACGNTNQGPCFEAGWIWCRCTCLCDKGMCEKARQFVPPALCNAAEW